MSVCAYLCLQCLARVSPCSSALLLFELLPTGDGPELRDMVIRAGIIPSLLQLIQSELPVSTDALLSF